MSEPQESSHQKPKSVNFTSIVMSTLSAAIGVQNRKNLENDFTHSSPLPYITAGIIFTIVFMGTLIVIAKLAIAE